MEKCRYYEKLLLRDEQLLNKSVLTSFKTLEPSYAWTNEDMFLYPNCDYKDKKILSVTSSGDNNLYLALNGATKIDSFDINFYAKFISALKIAYIKNFSYEEFYDAINDFHKTGDFFFKGTNYLYDLSDYLTEDEIVFWDVFQSLIARRKINIQDVIYLTGTFYNNPYFSYDNYNKLKKNLIDININYIDLDIHKVVELKENYDYILLSNILEYVLTSDTPLYVSRYKKIIQDLYNKLKQGGIIYGYDFNDLQLYLTKLPDLGLSFTKKYSKSRKKESLFILKR